MIVTCLVGPVLGAPNKPNSKAAHKPNSQPRRNPKGVRDRAHVQPAKTEHVVVDADGMCSSSTRSRRLHLHFHHLRCCTSSSSTSVCPQPLSTLRCPHLPLDLRSTRSDYVKPHAGAKAKAQSTKRNNRHLLFASTPAMTMPEYNYDAVGAFMCEDPAYSIEGVHVRHCVLKP
jgi:hypothetical protein